MFTSGVFCGKLLLFLFQMIYSISSTNVFFKSGWRILAVNHLPVLWSTQHVKCFSSACLLIPTSLAQSTLYPPFSLFLADFVAAREFFIENTKISAPTKNGWLSLAVPPEKYSGLPFCWKKLCEIYSVELVVATGLTWKVGNFYY